MFRFHHRRGRGILRWPLLIMLAPLFLLLGLSGCGRGSWHDPARAAEKVDSVAEDIADDLELRADQQPAFDALRDRLKAHVLNRAAGHREVGDVLVTEFEKDSVDVARVVSALKSHTRSRLPAAEIEAIIDDIAAFYQTLDAAQQGEVNKKVRRKLRWFH